MSKKRYTLVLTMVFFLTAALFIAVSADYDPWLDHDEDGDIDTDDLYLLAGEYGGLGDPTKNVNVTNFPLDDDGNLKVSVQETALQTYKDAVEITALDWSAVHVLGYDVGVYVWNLESCVIPFVFSPQGKQLVNVTDIWITITQTHGNSYQTIYFNITINDNTTITTEPFRNSVGWSPMINAIHIENTDIYNLIHPGVNTLEFHEVQGDRNDVTFYRIIVLIEYEYEA